MVKIGTFAGKIRLSYTLLSTGRCQEGNQWVFFLVNGQSEVDVLWHNAWRF
jgi:hypothetical protein